MKSKKLPFMLVFKNIDEGELDTNMLFKYGDDIR